MTSDGLGVGPTKQVEVSGLPFRQASYLYALTFFTRTTPKENLCQTERSRSFAAVPRVTTGGKKFCQPDQVASPDNTSVVTTPDPNKRGEVQHITRFHGTIPLPVKRKTNSNHRRCPDVTRTPPVCLPTAYFPIMSSAALGARTSFADQALPRRS